MSAAIHDRDTRTRASEEKALGHLVDRLVQQFPELSRDEVERAVHGQYADYADSRVRDFLPVLVERAVRKEFTSATAPRYRA